MSASPFQRRVNPGDLGRVTRFEIEHEDGTTIVYLGPAAEEHVAALNSACKIAQAHGLTNWPLTAPEIVPLAQIDTGHPGGLSEMARMALRQRHDDRPAEPRVSPMQFLVFSALIRAKEKAEARVKELEDALAKPGTHCPRCGRAYRFGEEEKARLCACCVRDIWNEKEASGVEKLPT